MTEQETPIADGAAPAMPRADALDALRGFAILTMALSGLIPFGTLPPWMYHAQVPPPAHVFDPNLPGLTWVDLVFPFFLFSMGAAMPLALQRRVRRGDRWWQLAGYVLKRGVLLAAFALYVQAIAPYVMAESPGARDWLLGLLGFVLLFPALARLPAHWAAASRGIVRTVGWGGAVVLLAFLRYPDGSGFSLYRSDIIIVVLANAAVFGSFIWLLSRYNWTLRACIMIGLIGLRLAHTAPGWVHQVWEFTPVPWIYRLYYLQYLCIVLPGTMVGDLVLDYLGKAKAAPAAAAPTTWRHGLIALLVMVLCGWVVVGYQARWTWQTPLVSVLGLLALAPLFRAGRSARDRMLWRIFAWGAVWLVIGMVFEPYEGGIKKDHPTLSYYFVTSGLACYALIVFDALGGFALGRRGLRLLVDNGQNPMIAYVGIRNLIPPVFALTGLSGWIAGWHLGPWPLAAIAGVKVLLLALAVSACTRARIYWRT